MEEIKEYIHVLGFLKYQWLLDEEEMLDKTLGPDTQQRLTKIQQSKKAKMREGQIGPLKHAIAHICKELGSTSYPIFLDKITPVKKDDNPIDNELVGDLYNSLSDPINIHHFELSETHLYFKCRDGKEKSRTINRIRTILSK